MPKLSDGEKDRLARIYKEELSPQISASLFTRTDMMKGMANPHEEAKRMVQPCIKLSGEAVQFADLCKVEVKNGNMVSRNNAAKMFKLIGKLLGMPTNIEVLRKDTYGGTVKVA